MLTFLAFEFLLLAFNDLIFQRALYMFDPDLGFKVRPYAVYGNERANEFGFNERDYPHGREPETFRVLILGDSFNWSGGQKGNYTALLDRRFEQEFGEGRVEIICAGYPQTHTGWLSNRFSVISSRACREELLHLFFPAGQVQVLPVG